MDQTTLTFLLSVVGTTLGIVLSIIKVYEFLREGHPILSVVVSLTGLPEEGNTITLLNASKVPANIWNYSLAWVKPGFLPQYIPLFRRVEDEESPFDYGNCDITVEAHSQYPLKFSEGDHFDWGPKMEHDIYLKLWMVGRRSPKWFWITGPSRFRNRRRRKK